MEFPFFVPVSDLSEPTVHVPRHIHIQLLKSAVARNEIDGSENKDF